MYYHLVIKARVIQSCIATDDRGYARFNRCRGWGFKIRDDPCQEIIAMKKSSSLQFLFLLVFGLFFHTIGSAQNGQTKKNPSSSAILKASLKAVGKTKTIYKIDNLISLAQCTSPSGAYTTEVHTHRNGYAYFKQVYSYRDAPFEIVTKGVSSGFIPGKAQEVISPNTVYAIRSHHFHNVILEVQHRFHDFEPAQLVMISGHDFFQIKAKDELNHPCSLFFDKSTHRLSAFHLQNPDDPLEIIKTRFSDWRNIQGLNLPQHLEIEQGDKVFTFDFVKIILNAPDFLEKSADHGQ